jgi:SAM-dependent methyltransferase
MLAPRTLKTEAVDWNAKWGAPYGKRPKLVKGRLARLARRYQPKLVGPFGFQPNNDTRVCEYPWIYEQIVAVRPKRVVEIGGSLSGMQFVLSSLGIEVINVDPGEDATGLGWPLRPEDIARLNRSFDTTVQLENSTLEEAAIAHASVDLVYSVSVLEHIPPTEVDSLVKEVSAVLRPGGRFVLTLDLFPDLAPFTATPSNMWGTNIDVARLVDASGLRLVVGDPKELCGYPEFDPEHILETIDSYYVGDGVRALAQLMVLEKSDGAP